MSEEKKGSLTRCRACSAEVDARLQVCPACGACCPGCSTEGLKVRISNTPAARRLVIARSSPCGKLLAMHEELGHALMEAIWEMDNLPQDTDRAIVRLYAIMDDLQQAIERTHALDPAILA
jgi:ferredoxin